jgi:hypothetical protein
MGTLKIPLRSICSKEGPYYRLGAKREEAVRSQATINLFTSLDILWWFHTRALLRSMANARKCQLDDFWEEERYESCSVLRTFSADAFRKKRKRENSTVVMILPGSHERLVLRNPRVLFQKHGANVRCTRAVKLVSSDFAKILKVLTKIRETCEKTLFTPPSPTKLLTLSFLFNSLTA